MAWARGFIEKLRKGETVQFRPRGNSMVPKIKSGALVTVEPASVETVEVGDVVLCVVEANEFLHYVKAIANGRAQIGNAKGRINGWTSRVFGRMVRVEP
jgi:phage repressor protein C with HTH and peptisase S24 domain